MTVTPARPEKAVVEEEAAGEAGKAKAALERKAMVTSKVKVEPREVQLAHMRVLVAAEVGSITPEPLLVLGTIVGSVDQTSLRLWKFTRKGCSPHYRCTADCTSRTACARQTCRWVRRYLGTVR